MRVRDNLQGWEHSVVSKIMRENMQYNGATSGWTVRGDLGCSPLSSAKSDSIYHFQEASLAPASVTFSTMHLNISEMVIAKVKSPHFEAWLLKF